MRVPPRIRTDKIPGRVSKLRVGGSAKDGMPLHKSASAPGPGKITSSRRTTTHRKIPTLRPDVSTLNEENKYLRDMVVDLSLEILTLRNGLPQNFLRAGDGAREYHGVLN
jgi:hypothetical protein